MDKLKFLIEDFNRQLKELKKKNKEILNKSNVILNEVGDNYIMSSKLKKTMRTLKIFDNQIEENILKEHYLYSNKER
jgi:hypothetical protein